MLGGEGACSMSADQFFIYQLTEFFIRQLEDFRYFMRGAEPIEEVQERHAGLEGCHLGDGGKVVRFLDTARGEQRKACLAASHHILMVAVNGKRVRGDRAGCHVEDSAGE